MASAPRSDKAKRSEKAGAGAPTKATASSSDPLRPDDHIDAEPAAARPASGIVQPKLGFVGSMRFVWRLLTSMRTALVLLLMLALAAVPGSLVPQRSSDPNGVIAFENNDPELFKVLDAFGLFSTFSSPWFSAIYLLLFVSLVGCIIPRTKHHFDAMRARPPKTPARLGRLVGYTERHSEADVETAVEEARATLKGLGYRVERYGTSISAERGYLRETGNLVFHTSLVGILLTVGIGSGFGYNGQKVIIQDTSFTNATAGYDSFNKGTFFTEGALEPFTVRLDAFEGAYQFDPMTQAFNATDFVANLSTRVPGSDWQEVELRVNHPVEIGGMKMYLLGNGYAPVVTVRGPDGAVAYEGPVAFLPRDNNLTSNGVIKVPDGLASELGLLGFVYPDPLQLTDGTYTSISPYSGPESLLTLTVWEGDLGLDAGVSVNSYSLNTDNLEQIAGPRADIPALEMKVGETAELPNGLGTIEFTELRRFATVEFHHDTTETWVLVFAILVIAGLLVSLFIPRRRMWIAATADGEGSRLEYAGLARGEDPTLAEAVADLATRHTERLERRINP